MKVIPLTIIGIVAFIMVFSYVATAILYGDYSLIGDERAEFTSPESFAEWFNPKFNVYLQWFEEEYDDKSQQNLINFITFDKNEWDISTQLWMILYRERWEIYAHYNEVDKGDEFYEYLKTSNNWEQKQNAKYIATSYNYYLNSFGLELVEGDIDKHKTATKNLWQQITEFLGKIPEGFAQFVKILTFSLPNMPANMDLVLKCIFFPLWIILMIGILPLVVDIIKAIGEIIPF